MLARSLIYGWEEKVARLWDWFLVYGSRKNQKHPSPSIIKAAPVPRNHLFQNPTTNPLPTPWSGPIHTLKLPPLPLFFSLSVLLHYILRSLFGAEMPWFLKLIFIKIKKNILLYINKYTGWFLENGEAYVSGSMECFFWEIWNKFLEKDDLK